jgi:sirohydrochlorin cobaltochelatase
MNGLILFAHGARDPRWAVPFERMQALTQAQKPDWQVALAFLELMTPSLPDVAAGMVEHGVTQITIAPLFLGPGGHLRNDFPLLLDALRTRYPQVQFATLPALGESETLLAAIASWVADSLH